jgi:thymidylate kinase
MMAVLTNFAVAEGIDGSGKSKIVEGLADWAARQGLKVFDLRR